MVGPTSEFSLFFHVKHGTGTAHAAVDNLDRLGIRPPGS
jgi:hypothetical protein